MTNTDYKQSDLRVLSIEKQAIEQLAQYVDAAFERTCELMMLSIYQLASSTCNSYCRRK